MNKMRYAVAILLLALMVPARAEDQGSANFMLPGCKGYLSQNMSTYVDAIRIGLCSGFINGLLYGVGGKEICQPKGATYGQAVAVVVKYIEARPERMHEEFGWLALEALTAAWPCKR
jgi:hypothetical protein